MQIDTLNQSVASADSVQFIDPQLTYIRSSIFIAPSRRINEEKIVRTRISNFILIDAREINIINRLR